MAFPIRRLAILALSLAFAVVAQAQTITPIGSGFNEPSALALDRQSNVFVTDFYAIKEVTAASNYGAVATLGPGGGQVRALAVDKSNNIFFVDFVQNQSVWEALAGDGYATVKPIGSGFVSPVAIALDAVGDVFVGDSKTSQVVELTAASGYGIAAAIGGTFPGLSGVSVNANGDLVVSMTRAIGSSVTLVAKAGGYTTATVLTSDVSAPGATVMNKNNDLFVADSTAVKKFTAASGYMDVDFVLSGTRSGALAFDVAGDLFAACSNCIGGIIEVDASGASTQLNLGPYLDGPLALALDAQGNIYIDGGTGVSKVPVAGGYATQEQMFYGIGHPAGIVVDSSGNVFFTDNWDSALKELPAAGGYSALKVIGHGLTASQLTIDSSDDIFVADAANNTVQEFIAASGYATVRTVGAGFKAPTALALDRQNNLFVLDGNGVSEVAAAGGYTATQPLGIPDKYSSIAVADNGDALLGGGPLKRALAVGGYTTIYQYLGNAAGGSYITLDSTGNVFSLGGNNVQKTTPPPPSPIAAAILPGARSVPAGATATAFASMINIQSAALRNCAIAMAPGSMILNYQTTDPATNALTGSADTPVTLAGNDRATFLLAFRDSSANNVSAQVPLAFSCDGVPAAQTIAGVNTISLGFFDDDHAAPDIIAVAATTSNDGLVAIPTGGAAAFSVAATNLGQDQSVTATADTGTTIMPLAVNICQTDPTTGLCLATPVPRVTIDFAQNATATFSVFLQATGPIALAPGYARAFVHFNTDSTQVGATSVAIESP